MLVLRRKKSEVRQLLHNLCFSSTLIHSSSIKDPYKGIPRKSTVGQPVGFLFGSPSKRFPISPDMQDPEISLHEVEEIDEIAEEEEEEGEYDR